MMHLLGKISAHIGERGGDICVLSATVSFYHFSCFIFTMPKGQLLLSSFHSLENGVSVK